MPPSRALAASALTLLCVTVAYPQPDPKGPPGFSITPATALTKAFADDPQAAAKKYGNFAPVAVQGEVARVATDGKGGVSVYLKGATDKLGVMCVFDAKDAADPAKLKAGATVIVAGAGYGVEDKFVKIGFCKLIPAVPPKADPPPPPSTRPVVPPKPVPSPKPAPAPKADPLVKVAAGTVWRVTPAAVGTPTYTNRDYKIAKLPKDLTAARVIQRAGGGEGDTGFLGGRVTAVKPATVYLAVMWQYNGERTVQEEAFTGLAGEGWKEVPGEFAVTTPPGEVWKWRVWSKAVPAGPITLDSQALPVGGIFFVKP